MSKNRIMGRVLATAGLVSALLVTGTSPAHADPELCTQHSYGKVCVQRYPLTHNIRATFYNNSGGANTLWLDIVKDPSAIMKMGPTVTVPYGSSTSINFTYGDTTRAFKACATFASLTSVCSPWT